MRRESHVRFWEGLGVKLPQATRLLVLCRQPDRTEEALELTDLVLEDLELDLNRDKTLLTSFDQGFRFLGLIFLGDAIYQPIEQRKKREHTPSLPPPLDLATYLELRNRR